MVRERGRRVLIGVGVALLVVTAGCGTGVNLGSQVSGDAGAQDAPAGETGAVEYDGEADGGSQVDEGELSVRKRAVIRTGNVRLRVEDFDAATRNLTRAVRGYGGFVSDSRVEVHRVDNATFRTGSLRLRVPRENFSAMLAHAKAVGRVEAASTTSEDVTEQLVDLEARLENLRAERDRLRSLYRSANDTEEVLAVEERLSEVQGEIERLEAKKTALERRVALSTITVELREPRPDRPPDADRKWYQTSVFDAFATSVDGVVTTVQAIVVAGAYALPYLLAFGLPVAGVGALARRRRLADGAALDEAGEEQESKDGDSTGEPADDAEDR